MDDPIGLSGVDARPSRAAARVASALAVLALLGGPAMGAAQTPAPSATPREQRPLTDLALEDLLQVKVETVFAASKLVQEVAQAPASISIITAAEIRAHGYRTLADILRSVRGFYVSYDRDYRYLGVRGFSPPGDYNSRVLVLVNGHRLNDSIFEGALLGTESPLDVALFERVEVIRGPSSSLYGTSAFFAVINIITRSPRSLNGVEVEGQVGSHALRSGRVTAGGRAANGVEGLLSATMFDTQGNSRLFYPEFAGTGGGDGFAYDADGDRSGSLFASAASGGFQLQAGYGSRRKVVPTGAFGTMFNDPRTRTRDARAFADLQFTRRLPSAATLQARAAYDHYAYDGTYAYETGLFRDAARGAWITTELMVSRRVARHGLTGGVEYRRNLRQDQWASDETGMLLDDNRGSTVAAVFVQDELRISRHLLVNAGLRWDHYFDTFGGTLNPRVALIASPADATTIKLLYGRAFRAPTPFELYYYEDGFTATLRPERIGTHEFVWEQRAGNRLQLTGSVFHNRVRNLITQDSGSEDSLDGLYYRNGPGVTATGVELEAKGELPGRVRGRVAHAFQTAGHEPASVPLSNSPGRLTTVVADAPLGRSAVIVGFNAYYIGERRTVRGTRVPGALLSDVTLSRPQSGAGPGLAVSLYNLFDAAYGDPGAEEHRQDVIPQDGRTLMVRASWRF